MPLRACLIQYSFLSVYIYLNCPHTFSFAFFRTLYHKKRAYIDLLYGILRFGVVSTIFFMKLNTGQKVTMLTQLKDVKICFANNSSLNK